MRRIPSIALLVLPVLLLAAACGGEDTPGSPTSGKSPEERARDALLEMFALAPKADVEVGSRYVVYRGPDKARKWKDVSDPKVDVEKQYVVSVLGTIARLLEAGPPTFVDFRMERESEGTWHGWTVRFGEGEKAKTAMFGLLEVKGRLVLGDID